MKPSWILILIALILGGVIGYAIGSSGETDPQTRGVWPDYPCPPDSTTLNCQDALGQIMGLAYGGGRPDIGLKAIACLTVHATMPNHMGEANLDARSNEVWKALEYAQAGEWDKCGQELEHQD
ncbi:MAG: hypothetical protein V3T86_10430 [Planctomycetota bacterium]